VQALRDEVAGTQESLDAMNPTTPDPQAANDDGTADIDAEAARDSAVEGKAAADKDAADKDAADKDAKDKDPADMLETKASGQEAGKAAAAEGASEAEVAQAIAAAASQAEAAASEPPGKTADKEEAVVGVVIVTMTIEGLYFSSLSGDLVASLNAAVSQGIAGVAGEDTSATAVVLTAGDAAQVKVVAEVMPPFDVTATGVTTRLLANDGSKLAETVLALVSAVDGIDALAMNPIAVTHVQVTRGVLVPSSVP